MCCLCFWRADYIHRHTAAEHCPGSCPNKWGWLFKTSGPSSWDTFSYTTSIGFHFNHTSTPITLDAKTRWKKRCVLRLQPKFCWVFNHLAQLHFSARVINNSFWDPAARKTTIGNLDTRATLIWQFKYFQLRTFWITEIYFYISLRTRNILIIAIPQIKNLKR